MEKEPIPDKGSTAGRIMVALDFGSGEEAMRVIRQLQGIPCWLKVGMELYYAAGPEFVRELKQLGHRVFLDLKLHDIPNTVRGAARSIARLGVDMFNVHAAGGLRMMEAALEGVRDAAAEGVPAPVVIAVTQLTSTDQTVLNEQIGIPGTMEEAVLKYASLAREAGLHGVVASSREVRRLKRELGAGFLAVTPGIRPEGSDRGDQARVMTPREAFAEGADYIVIGRPITRAPDPRQSLLDVITSVESPH
jgi:orotidine-5'-phosphate decarboxylase